MEYTYKIYIEYIWKNILILEISEREIEFQLWVIKMEEYMF